MRYWSSELKLKSIQTQKKRERGQYAAILTEQDLSTKQFIYGRYVLFCFAG